MKPPLPIPCPSCPYRRDVPSGVWDRSEYDKLPAYDNDTADQPMGVFMCHQASERDERGQGMRICSGWAGCHDLGHNLGLRFAVISGDLSKEDYIKTVEFTVNPAVPLFGSGREAREHGLRELDSPGHQARKVITKLETRREQRGQRERREQKERREKSQ